MFILSEKLCTKLDLCSNHNYAKKCMYKCIETNRKKINTIF